MAQGFGFGQRDPVLSGLASSLLYVLQHGVQNSSGKVRLGIRQSLGVIGPRRLGECQHPLPLQVISQYTTLPDRPVLQEELGQHADEWKILCR